MKYKQLQLKNQLCFPLYACSKEIVKQYRPLLDKVGLTYTQYITMMVLWEHESLTVKELGRYLYLDSGTITPLIKKLEKDNVVQRVRDTEDERKVYVHLTIKGKELQNRVKDIPFEVGSYVGLSDDEAKTLYELLYKILNNMSK
ncbi:MAG: MarR family winged helix-turn-helix transcriptional regulator [Eubacteriaceae bacterium]